MQERTIYARPLNFRPRLLWLVMGELRTALFVRLDPRSTLIQVLVVYSCNGARMVSLRLVAYLGYTTEADEDPMMCSFLAADTVHMKVEWDAKVAALEQEQAATTTGQTTKPVEATSVTPVAVPSDNVVVKTSPEVPPSTTAPAPSPFDDLLSIESILSGFLLTCGGAISVLVLFYPTRVVRRISQIRKIPGSQLSSKPSVVASLAKLPEPAKTRVDVQKGEQLGDSWIRVETAAEGMWAGRWGLPRDVRTERVRPGLIRGGTSE